MNGFLVIFQQKLECIPMTRMSKQGERRAQYPRKTKDPLPKSGPKKDNLKLGFKEHANAISGATAERAFIPKIK